MATLRVGSGSSGHQGLKLGRPVVTRHTLGEHAHCSTHYEEEVLDVQMGCSSGAGRCAVVGGCTVTTVAHQGA